MKNFVKPGHMMTVPAPADTLSGDLVVVGSMFGVAATSALAGADVEIKCGGVFELPKLNAQAWTVGAPVYWDPAVKTVTTAAGALAKIGVAAAAAANPSAIGRVRLNGSF